MKEARSRRARAACLLLALAGCAAKRELVILSDPPGALVRLDDAVVGLTPYEENFFDYGTRRLTVYREGYRTSSMPVELVPPWYARFPIDIFSEVIFPVGWRHRHVVRVTLEPAMAAVTRPALEKVLERANTLRLAGPEGPLSAPSDPAASKVGEDAKDASRNEAEIP